MMETVKVELGARSYPIHIGSGIVPALLQDTDFKGGIAVVTDHAVAGQAWFQSLEDTLKGLAPKYARLVVPSGESSKSLDKFSALCSQLAQQRFSRSATIIAVGGGVVGDLAGFLAASYLRGVKFIQIPTTLLAAVDSSVGGKTGVNLPEGKNLVGAFYQPQRVLIDLDFLKTLPEREMAAGMAEVIKYGLIRDSAFFAQVRKGRPSNLAAVIKRCVEIKAEVVAGDEREESGLRAILNFGHTLGHAIEQSVGYGELLHGEAISIGMVAATYLSQKCCGLAEGTTSVVQAALSANGLPVDYPGLSFEQLQPAFMRDKKATSAGILWVLMPEVGTTKLSSQVTDSQIREAIQFCSR